MKQCRLIPVAMVGSLISQPILAKEAPSKEKQVPNIILIMTDQQRFDCIGAMGNNVIKTPNIDGLAENGAVFTNAYTSTPSSTPARAGLLTGCSPWKHGMLGYYKIAKKYEYEMPRMLSDAGYYSFAIGKLHYAPQRNLHGFDAAVLDESGRIESPDFVSDYRQWFTMEAPGLNPDSTHVGWNDHAGKAYTLDENLHPTKWTGNEAVRFIKNYELDKPLFLKVSFARPHSPYDPPARYADMYDNADLPKPWKGDWADKFADGSKTPDAAFGDFGEEHALNSRKHYYGAVTFVDDQIGRVIQALKEKGIYDNSLIIFLSDHGDMLGDHYHWRKTYAYEGSSHIPFIVKPPSDTKHAIKGSVRKEQVVELRDVLPTFLDIANIEKPKSMDGMSLLPILKDDKADWRAYLDLEHAETYAYDNYWAGLTDGNQKYIWFFHTGEEQLFDLRKDRGEEQNLAKDNKYKKDLEKWRTRMLEHLSVRGEPYVKDGKLNQFKETILISPNYPK